MGSGSASFITSVRYHLGQMTPAYGRRNTAHSSRAETWSHSLCYRCAAQYQQDVCVCIQWTQNSPLRCLVPYLRVPTCKVEQAGKSSSWKLQLEIVEGEYGAAAMEDWRGSPGITQTTLLLPSPDQIYLYTCNASNRNVSELSWKSFPMEIPLCPLTVCLGLCCPFPNVQVSFLQFRHITFYPSGTQRIGSSVWSLLYIWSPTWCLLWDFSRCSFPASL